MMNQARLKVLKARDDMITVSDECSCLCPLETSSIQIHHNFNDEFEFVSMISFHSCTKLLCTYLHMEIMCKCCVLYLTFTTPVQ